MAGTVVCAAVPTGLTLTATVFPDGSDTAAETGTACTEATNRKSVYTFATSASGLHLIHLKSGSNVVWSGWAYLASTGTINTYDSRLEANAGQSSGLALKSDVPTTSDIRTELSTELGRIDAAVSSRSTLTAANVRTELGTELGRIDAAVSTRLAAASYTAPDNSTIAAIQTLVDALPTLTEIRNGGDIDGFSFEESLKLILAALAGKLSGAAGTTITIRSADDTADRIVATVDSNGNRTSLTLNAAG